MSGKQKSKNKKIRKSHSKHFLFWYFLRFRFFSGAENFVFGVSIFCNFAFFVRGTCAEEKYKITKNGNAKNKIFSARKKFKIAKIPKQKMF